MSMDQGIAMVDANMNITLHNWKLEELLGFLENVLDKFGQSKTLCDTAPNEAN